MDITVQFLDEIEKQLAQFPDGKIFIVHATERALRKRWLDEQTAVSIRQADNGEYADEKEV